MRILFPVLMIVLACIVGVGLSGGMSPSGAVPLALSAADEPDATPSPTPSVEPMATATTLTSTETAAPPSPTVAPIVASPTAVPPTSTITHPSVTATPQPSPSPRAQAPTLTPTPAPAVPTATSSGLVASANVSNPAPVDQSTVVVLGKLVDSSGKGVSGATMHTIWNYRTTTQFCDGGPTAADGSASCAREVIQATLGYTVHVDVVFSLGGNTYQAQTSFTPH